MTCSELTHGDYWRFALDRYLVSKLLESLNNHIEGSMYRRVGRNSTVVLKNAEGQLRRPYEIKDFIFLILPPWDLVA